MMSVDRMAERLAITIRENNPDSSSLAVLKYGLVALINQVIVMSCVVILSLFTGKVIETIVAMFAFPLIRYFSGGFHLKSSSYCNIMTVGILLISVYVPLEYWYNGFVINIIAVVILAIYAPSGIKRNKLGPQYNPLLKLITLVIAASNFYFTSPVLAITFFIQSLTTLRIFNKDS